MPARPQYAQLLQPAPYLRPRLAVLLRQTVAQRPVRQAQPEALDHLPVVEAALLQIGKTFRARLQGLVIEGHHPLQKRLIVRIRCIERFELLHRGA